MVGASSTEFTVNTALGGTRSAWRGEHETPSHEQEPAWRTAHNTGRQAGRRHTVSSFGMAREE